MKNLLYLLLIPLFLAACDNNDENPTPITLNGYESTTFSLWYSPSEQTIRAFQIEGGDGNYTVKSSNPEIIRPEIIVIKPESSTNMNLKMEVLGIGDAKITITDKSQNQLVLNIETDYLTDNFIVRKCDVNVEGDDLTTNEKKAISEKYVSEIPVKVGGGYKFIFSEEYNNYVGKGKAIIYIDSYGKNGIETTFELKQPAIEGAVSSYDIIIGGEKRSFTYLVYKPLTKAELKPTMAFIENITEKVQKEFPKAMVYTSQVVEASRN